MATKKRAKKKNAKRRPNPKPTLVAELGALIRRGKTVTVSPGGVRKGKLMARLKVKK